MNIFDVVTHSDICEAVGIKEKSGYKIKLENPDRYRRIAISVLVDRIGLEDIVMAADVVQKLRKQIEIDILEVKLCQLKT